MKTENQNIRDKKRLVMYLLRLSEKGAIIQLNLQKLCQEIYQETGQVFSKSEYGVFNIFSCPKGSSIGDEVTGGGAGAAAAVVVDVNSRCYRYTLTLGFRVQPILRKLLPKLNDFPFILFCNFKLCPLRTDLFLSQEEEQEAEPPF